ncbi:HD-like signal output (HDOD) protein [Plasticicumulans lactativorans]|uniref:HD-like signal output (HDOD) protein n=1 Tax=Plasticicumulans lactativorans TaxID=1133106 RepID=A0A4R2LCH9_9GAMM|nr:HDOD domain-containing protein [Plasticicumulans lactativorans]TCO82062.1 HD-like signal output (HDOD) protein [Plasticicumulans lactativorans]
MDKALEARLRATQLSSLPGVALRIVALAGESDPEPNDVLAAVALDPALTARVLRAANSALYNARGRVRSLNQALMLMGVKGVLNLALGFTFRHLLAGGAGHARYWRRSVLAAIAARETAQRVALSAVDESFIAALLQDIGIPALAAAAPEAYAREVGEPECHAERCAAERRAFGCDHAEVGAWLLTQWGFPDSLIDVVRLSHDPGDGPSGRRIGVRCVAVSGPIADICLEPDVEAATERAWALFDRWLGYDAEVLGAVLDALRGQLAEVAILFELDAFDAARLDGIATQARRLLAVRTAVEVARPDDDADVPG